TSTSSSNALTGSSIIEPDRGRWARRSQGGRRFRAGRSVGTLGGTSTSSAKVLPGNSIIELVLDVPRGGWRFRAGGRVGTLFRGGTSTSSTSNLSPSSGLGQYHGAGAGGDIRPGAGLLVPQRPPDPQPATQPADQRDAYPVHRLTAG